MSFRLARLKMYADATSIYLVSKLKIMISLVASIYLNYILITSLLIANAYNYDGIINEAWDIVTHILHHWDRFIWTFKLYDSSKSSTTTLLLCGCTVNSAEWESCLCPYILPSDDGRTFFVGRELNSLLAENAPTFLYIPEGRPLFRLSRLQPSPNSSPFLLYSVSFNSELSVSWKILGKIWTIYGGF